MILGLRIGTILLGILGSGAPAIAGNISREPVDRLWEEHMLAGTSADYIAMRPARRLRYIPQLERSKGTVELAAHKPHGIRISDYSGTRLFGLLRGGGWSLQGGLLDWAPSDGGAAELYVKQVSPMYPGLIDNSAPIKEQSYEFFLLYRPSEGAQARILRKWLINPEEVHWYVPDYLLTGPLRVDDETVLRGSEMSDVRGFLAYDPSARIATITITGLKHPFEERVELSSDADN
jgi:hypothetical protein